uniref:Disease resistance protein Roq1-like winged-helix domain-containing protein n=1 Tax=Tanacetum cinerariifolium TaxID=118510 RepID=A0A6L2MA25_TANCI|nr:hypothetical protein [Tanacetum cinerariifolium]
MKERKKLPASRIFPFQISNKSVLLIPDIDGLDMVEYRNDNMIKVPMLLAETVFIEEIVKEIYHRLGVPLNTTLPLLIGMDYNIKSSIVENISRRCGENFNGLLDLQKQLCGDISKTSSIQGQDVISVIENALVNKKVFLVLDDVDSFVQLDALLGKRVPMKGYGEVSDDIVKYSEGHPLALEVLGRSLHNQDVAYWEDYLDRLKKESNSRIEKVLEMSFRSLPDNDKELFKYIACFFVGKDRDFTEIVLKACGINTRSGITNLIQRCLVSIWSNRFQMHSLIQDMGRDLVRQEAPNKPWMRSRLWDHEESFNVLKRRKGTEDILGLYLDMRMLKNQTLRGSFELQTDTLSNLDNLKLLQLNYVHTNGSYENFPQELRWLCMHGFPLECIPSDLRMENLVALDMSYSNIKSFDMPDSLQPPAKRQKRLIGSCSKDKRSLGSLKILDLSFCEQLLCLGGFFELPSLERLIVTNCIHLVEVCELIEQCAELSLINLSYCNKLKKLPTSLGKLEKVKTLLLDGCDLHEPPVEMRGMDSQEIVRDIKSQEFSCEAIPNPDMSPLKLEANFESFKPWSIEIEGMFKSQSMSGAVNILSSLGWINSDNTSVRRRGHYIKPYYKFGIFSTLYSRKAMPSQIRDRNKGRIISFTIPLSPRKLRGLNFCYLQTFQWQGGQELGGDLGRLIQVLVVRLYRELG